MLKLDQIARVHVELTTRCNARCPMCPRNYRGYDFNSGYPITELSLEDFKQIFKPEFLKQLRAPALFPGDVYGVSFNGNLGDFAAARDGLEIVKYLVENDTEVSIYTNGSLRSPNWWRQFAMPKVRIGFALDGLEDTHSIYRQDTDWNRVIENASAFIAAGGHAIWRFIPFDHNRHQEEQCKKLAEKLGFKHFENIYDGRDNGPVFNRDGSFSHQIGPKWNPADTSVPDIKPLLESHITWFDHRTVQIEKDRPTTEISCLHIRRKELYVSADGSVYPCCFLGFYPNTMNHPGNQQLKELVQENNALVYGLEHSINWFNRVEETWAKPSIKEGRLYQCVSSCGRLN